MKNLRSLAIVTTLLLSFALAACQFPGKYYEKRSLDGTCPTDRSGPGRAIEGSAFVHIRYGDSYVEVDPKAEVSRGKGALEFVLKPDPSHGSGIDPSSTVMIKGTGAPTGGDASWLDSSGSFDPANPKNNSFVVCPRPDTALGEYKYEVSVQGVGKIDPRAGVIP